MSGKIRLMLLCGAVFSAGCASIKGQWETTGVEPAGAVRNFSIGQATFNNDGTYEAMMVYDGEQRMSTGTYKHCCNRLTLMPEQGQKRTYEAHVARGGKQLTLEYHKEGHDMEVHMEKKGCAKDCSKDCCKH